MLHTAITFQPKAMVAFTMREIELMLRASVVHYDAVCKQASARYGLLDKARNYHHNTGGKPYEFTWEELDTLAKICELEHAFTAIEAEVLRSIRSALVKVLKALNEATIKPIEVQ